MAMSVLFDFDGTLVDSMFLWDSFAHRYVVSQGKTPEPSLREDLRVASLFEASCFLKERYQLPKTPEQISQEINELALHVYMHEVRFKPGARRLLESLYARNIPIAIASVTDEKLIDAFLTKEGVRHTVGAIASVSHVGKSKDHPDVYIHAAQLLGSELEECWVVEDAVHALYTARNAGFLCVALQDDSQAGGYLAYSTCSTLKDENHHIIGSFVKSARGAAFASSAELTQYMPKHEHDGHFLALCSRASLV